MRIETLAKGTTHNYTETKRRIVVKGLLERILKGRYHELRKAPVIEVADGNVVTKNFPGIPHELG
jgi:hypothetical protein